MPLTNKVALITGAGRGIGAATACRLAAAGAAVAICARTAAQLDATAAQITAQGGSVLALAGDISEATFVERLFAATHERWGRLDILVNNAAVIDVRPFLALDPATWDRILAVNLRAAYLCSRAAFGLMSGHGGVILNVSSLSGVRGTEKFPGFTAYIVSKYGLLGLTESLAVEGKPYGIRVNAVSLGAVDTAMLAQAAPFLKTETTPVQVAETLYWLAGDTAGHINGANLEIFSNA